MTTSHLSRRLGTVALVVALALSLQACDTTQGEAPSEPEGDVIELSGVSANNIHDDFEQVANQIPGFGGFFLNEDGQPSVYVLQPDSIDLETLERALRDAFGVDILERGDSPHRKVDDPQIQLLEGTYSMQELLPWFEQTSGVFEIEEAVFVDLHERENTLSVGITDREAQAAVENYLAGRDIPLEAVNIVEANRRAPQAHDLRSNFGSAQGGIEIGLAGSNTVCSHGYVARLDGEVGFVTNSHCTAQRGRVTGTDYTTPGTGGRLGEETVDPRYQNCYGGSRVCRQSDAAFVEYGESVTSSAAVARPQDWAGPSANASSLNIDPERNLSVRGGEAHPVSGEIIDKVGRTTGWTWGFVQKTCIAMGVNGGRVNGKPIVMKCQYDGSYKSAGGDSGSAVFKWHGDEVTIFGVHWGSGGVFSPLQGLYADF